MGAWLVERVVRQVGQMVMEERGEAACRALLAEADLLTRRWRQWVFFMGTVEVSVRKARSWAAEHGKDADEVEAWVREETAKQAAEYLAPVSGAWPAC